MIAYGFWWGAKCLIVSDDSVCKCHWFPVNTGLFWPEVLLAEGVGRGGITGEKAFPGAEGRKPSYIVHLASFACMQPSGVKSGSAVYPDSLPRVKKIFRSGWLSWRKSRAMRT